MVFSILLLAKALSIKYANIIEQQVKRFSIENIYVLFCYKQEP